MSEQHTDRPAYFISHRASDAGDGSLERPFLTLRAALSRAQTESRARSNGDASPRQRHHFEIVCVDHPGTHAKRPREPRFQFYVDPYIRPEQPDGSETAPWSDATEAIAQLAQLDEQGGLRLAPGDRLAVIEHEVFTPTSLEQVKKRKETIAKYVFMTMAMSLVAPVIAILAYLTIQAWPALTFDFLLTNPHDMGRLGGIWAPLVGTFMLVLISLLLAAPIGVLAGVYLNEYARDNWFTRIVNLAVVNLAGVPSIVHGLFGFGAFVLFAGIGKSVLAASCTLAVMTLPVIITSTREALASVPMAFREACWNMGASRWQTIRSIVLPNSISGILTGVILQVSRVAGETAPILFTGAAALVSLSDDGLAAYVPFSLFEPFMALSYHLYLVRTQIEGVPITTEFGAAVVLIGLVLVVNSLSIAIRVYLRSRKKW